MKNILYFLTFIFLVSCKNSQKDKISKKKIINDTISIKISKNENIKPNQIKKDSIFLVKALPLEVNSTNCYWEYQIKESDQKMFILNQKLKSVASNSILFETTNEVNNSNSTLKHDDIVYIETHQLYNLECEDINKDGYCDFKILIERAAAGANETYEVFLFNPRSKKFEYSKVFSGTNVEYDKEKNRISFMWKMGARSYSFGYANLKKNKRDIAFFEDIHQDQDTIVYTKSIGKKIIERKKVVLKKEEWQGDEVNPEDSQYLLERNKK
jgi:hypothetical protein